MSHGFKISLLLLVNLLFLTSCNGGINTSLQQKEDSLRRVDSIREVEMAIKAAEQTRIDSIDRKALKADTLSLKHIVIDKESCNLYLRENGKTIMKLPVCLGKGIGQKKRLGDHKTPEGEFKIKSIENPTSWTYDFHDGRGKVTGTYGPYFFRLNTPQSTHIGIHGTCFPESMGKRESDGCVRLRNEDLEELRKHITIGMPVIINPDKPTDN